MVKQNVIRKAVLAASILGAGYAHAAETTVVAAKQAVRSFLEDPNVVIPEPKQTPDGRHLRFQIKPGWEYWVEKSSGRVTWVLLPSHISDMRTNGTMTREQVETTARKYAEQHFHYFLTKNLRVVASGSSRSVTVMFEEMIAENSAYSGNLMAITVDTRNGKVVSASVQDLAIPAAARRQPRISHADARQIALRSLGAGPGSVIDSEQLTWSNQSDDRLLWGVSIDAELPNHLHGLRSVSIDAQTGAVISTSQARTPDR